MEMQRKGNPLSENHGLVSFFPICENNQPEQQHCALELSHTGETSKDDQNELEYDVIPLLPTIPLPSRCQTYYHDHTEVKYDLCGVSPSGRTDYDDCSNHIDAPPSDQNEQTSKVGDLQRDATGCMDEKCSRISTKESFHECLIEVDDELGDEDVVNLKFLCRDFIPAAKLEKASRALDIFDNLERSAKISVGNVDFLLECLLEMHRLDLIKKFGFDPKSVRQKAGQGPYLGPTPFRKLLFELAEDLSDDEIRRIKFVLKNEYLKRGNLQALETAQELFIFLEKEGKLSAENVQVLYDIFKVIKREELVRQVDLYYKPDRRNTQMGPGPSKFQRVSSFPQTNESIQPINGNAASNLQQNLGSQGGQVPGINRSSSAGTIELEESEQPQHPVISDVILLKIAADMKDILYEDIFLELGLTKKEGPQYTGPSSMENVYKLLKYWRDVKMKDTPRQVLPSLKYICGRFGRKASLQHLDALARDQQRTYVLQARTDQTPFVDQHYQLPYQRTQTLEQQGVQTLGPVQLEPHVLYVQTGLRDRFGQMGPQQTWKQTQLFNDIIIGSDQVRPRVHFEQVAPQQGMVWPQGNIGQGRSQVQEPVRSQENVEIRSQAQQPVNPRAGSEPLPYPQEQQQARPQQMTPTPNVRNIDLETDFPCYKMDARPRGICLIISNRNFTVTAEDADSKEMPARQGTEKDTEYLSQIFRKLNFIVQIKEDLKDFEMARALVDIAQNTDHTRYDCFVCCILSHGALGHVFGSNGKLIPIRDLTSCVQANRCHTLAGKPKLFFIQACQGRDKQQGTEIEADGPSVPEDLEMDSGGEMIPNEADFLLGYATVPGYVSFRSRTSGSWYIRKLVQMLDRYHDKTDLMSIMVKVNEEVSKADANVEDGRYKQTPAPFVTLRKRLFFR